MSDLEETPERALARVIDRQARDIERLTAEVERLRGGLWAILREHGPSVGPWRGDRCGICSPQDKHYPCVTVQEARAALEEGE